MRHVSEAGSVGGFGGAEPIANEQLLELEVDWLVPAALGSVIDNHNAGAIRARVVVEAANHPVTPEADALLHDAGVTVIPDIMANSGGVTVSYFEWTQNIQQYRWSEEQVNAELRKVMTRMYADVAAFRSSHDSQKLTFREAAFALGVERVHRAAHLRGYV
jgi:glutamate dehydrogenase (NAD(P)+)